MNRLLLSERRLDFLLRRLTASVLLLALLLAVVRFAWYPGVHFQLNGTWKFVAILAGVTLTLGPGVTTLIYRREKKGMKFDIAVILVVEILALAIAGATLQERRPAYLVFAVDRFETVTARDVANYPFRYPELAARDGIGPSIVLARFPDDAAERAALKYAIFFEGAPDISLRPDHWYPYQSGANRVVALGRELGVLRAAGEPWSTAVDRWLSSADGREQDYVFLPATGTARDGSIIVERATGRTVGMLDLDPWI